MGIKSLFGVGSTHDPKNDLTHTQAYALADGSYLHQGRCTCGWFSDVYLEEREFVEALRETHADTGN